MLSSLKMDKSSAYNLCTIFHIFWNPMIPVWGKDRNPSCYSLKLNSQIYATFIFFFFYKNANVIFIGFCYRKRSVCLGQQCHGSMWAGPHLDASHQTQEGDWSRRGFNTADHCRHLPQPGLDSSSHRQVSRETKTYFISYDEWFDGFSTMHWQYFIYYASHCLWIVEIKSPHFLI